MEGREEGRARSLDFVDRRFCEGCFDSGAGTAVVSLLFSEAGVVDFLAM